MKLLRWILINSFIAFVAVNALYLERQWAQNLLLFAVWSYTIMVTMVVFLKESREKAKKKKFAVPQYVSVTYDLLLLIALVMCGWFVSASVWLWQMYCEAALRREKEEEQT